MPIFSILIPLFLQFVVKGEERRNVSSEYKIPKVLYQSWWHKNLSQYMDVSLEQFKKNKAANPDIEFQLWDDEDVETFLKSEFPSDVYEAYSHINPLLGAARGDFFRYAIIYKRGGLWLDVESSLHTPKFFGDIIKPDDECILDKRRDDLVAYRSPSQWGYPTHEQWFLAAMPNHPYFDYAVKQIVRSYKKHLHIKTEFKNGVLRYTGPDMFTAAVHLAMVDHGMRHREIVCDKVMTHYPNGFPGAEYHNPLKRGSKHDHYDDIRNLSGFWVTGDSTSNSDRNKTTRHRHSHLNEHERDEYAGTTGISKRVSSLNSLIENSSIK